eukprot:gb/GECG01013009.1/.p1 GENE.gb/GECG01013009.1/~~gb/GECG01013009.1/.p1  ORF type:complete len:196 (+),score=21.97 gb/GECG01013009.1/:1-588(+)
METVTFSNDVTIMRPTSHASWPRRTRGEPSTGVFLESDYHHSTKHSKTKGQAQRTVKEHAPKETRLIRQAIDQVPTSFLDRSRQEAREQVDEKQRSRHYQAPSDEELEETLPESVEQDFQNVTETMQKSGHHGRKGRIIREFFGGGVSDGPFPGSQSENGVHAAECFYKDRRPLGGLWPLYKPPSVTIEGQKFPR